MKKNFVLILLALALLLAALPTIALAAAPAEVKVFVRNTTGANAELSLTDAAGNKIFKTLEPGVSDFTLTEGLYAAYVSTVCGAYADSWNVNVNKTLYIECKGAAEPVVQYGKCTWVGENESLVLRNGQRGTQQWNAHGGGFYDLSAVYDRIKDGLPFPVTFNEFVNAWMGDASCRFGVLEPDWHRGSPFFALMFIVK